MLPAKTAAATWKSSSGSWWVPGGRLHRLMRLLGKTPLPAFFGNRVSHLFEAQSILVLSHPSYAHHHNTTTSKASPVRCYHSAEASSSDPLSMRQKRAKTYRKLLHKYVLHFGFREPYQILVDAAFALSLTKQKIEDMQKRLEDVIQAKGKLMITQCAMVQLYKQEKEGDYQKRAVQLAKDFERRKCNHKEAIDVEECITSVIGA